MESWEASKRKIEKVPSFLRDKSDAYDPKVISFGPYHHGKPELQFCQNAKHRTLQMFVEGSSHTDEFFKGEVGKVVAYARSCYVEDSTNGYTDKQFVEMMLLDACFLIFCMDVFDKINYKHYFAIRRYLGKLVYSMINRDMLLVENQIPFRVVMHLINLRYGREKGEEAVTKFMHECTWSGYGTLNQAEFSEKILQYQNPESPLHILEAFHRDLVGDCTTRGVVIDVQDVTGVTSNVKSFRSAKDLKAKGIYLKPSEKRSLASINFNSFTFYGQLELPVLFVTHLSKVFFPNLIAYELSPFTNVNPTVTSYVAFMKSLIEKPADVKELRENRILLHTLGNDEEVAQFYWTLDTLGWGGVFGDQRLMRVRQIIQEHYDSKAFMWTAEFIHTYLSSPWSIIGLLAAFLLLILTFLQTYFTIVKK